MLLLVGLGNPGSNYTNTRHNIGFKIIDAINTHFKLSKQKPKFKGLLTTGNIDEQKIYAIKPLTFMNNSGTAIKELIDYFKIDAKDVFVFHDDMDIDFGKIKAKFGRLAVFSCYAPHNGHDLISRRHFFHHLHDCVDSVSVNGPKFIYGDFNARLHFRSANEHDIR